MDETDLISSAKSALQLKSSRNSLTTSNDHHSNGGNMTARADLSRSMNVRYNHDISEHQRMELVLNELSIVSDIVETKTIKTQLKANIFQFINTLSSFLIIIFSAVIVGIQAASDCVNIPVIVLSALIFIVESVHKLLNWGPQGIRYKTATIQLKRISGNIRYYMYMFYKFSSEQLLSIVNQLRSQYDDIDMGLYSTSTTGNVRYDTGLDIEEGGNSPTNNTSIPNITSVTNPSYNGQSNKNESERSSPHVHIHLDQFSSTSLPNINHSRNSSLTSVTSPPISNTGTSPEITLHPDTNPNLHANRNN